MEEVKIQKPPKKYMNSYLAGVLLGIVIVLSFFFTREGLGASGAFKRGVAKVEQYDDDAYREKLRCLIYGCPEEEQA